MSFILVWRVQLMFVHNGRTTEPLRKRRLYIMWSLSSSRALFYSGALHFRPCGRVLLYRRSLHFPPPFPPGKNASGGIWTRGLFCSFVKHKRLSPSVTGLRGSVFILCKPWLSGSVVLPFLDEHLRPLFSYTCRCWTTPRSYVWAGRKISLLWCVVRFRYVIGLCLPPFCHVLDA